MESPYLKRRQELRIAEQEADGQKKYIISDENTDVFYQLEELEFEIFWNLDGETSPEALKEKIEKRVGNIVIPLEELSEFIEDLKHKGLLEGFEARREKQPRWREIFYLRFKAFNPDKLLEKLIAPLSFLFSEPFIIMGLLFIAWSLIFTSIHREQWFSQTKALLHGWGFALFYVSLFVVGFVHEMGHSITCKHFGGRVKEMGFMLIYFQPAFYANVSDSYLFPEKKQKVFVGAAGLFYQFIFSALLIIAWTLTIPDSLYSSAMVAMIAMSGFSALINLNPLIKLDGYYILSDWLSVTNLRANSFQYLRLKLQQWLFDLPETREEINRIPKRLRKIYAWYGIGGIFYTALLLYWISSFVVRFLIRDLQTLGFLLIAGGIAWGFWNWYKRNAPEISRLREKVSDSPERERMFKAKKRTVGSAVALLLLLVGVLIWTRWGLKGPCEVKPEIKRGLAPLESGIIVKVLKRSGESVHKGEIFAQMDDFEIQRELNELKVLENLKKAHLTALKADYGASVTLAEQNFHEAHLALAEHDQISPFRIQEARDNMRHANAAYEKAVAAADNAKREWERYQILDKENLASPKEVETKKLDYQSAVNDEAAAKAERHSTTQAYRRILSQLSKIDPEKLRTTVSDTQKSLTYTRRRSAEIQEAQYDLEDIQSRIKTDEEKLQRMAIRSPLDGIIMTPHITELEGKMVGRGEPVAWVYEPGPMIFEIRVDDLDVSEVPTESSTRNDVKVKLLALPGQSFRGKVRKIVPESLTNPRSKDYLVDVAVDDQAGSLLPGMQGTGKIYGKWHPVLWQLIRRPVKYMAWKLWSLF